MIPFLYKQKCLIKYKIAKCSNENVYGQLKLQPKIWSKYNRKILKIKMSKYFWFFTKCKEMQSKTISSLLNLQYVCTYVCGMCIQCQQLDGEMRTL